MRYLVVYLSFLQYLRCDTIAAFADVLEQVLDSSSSRHTKLCIEVTVEHFQQLRSVRNNPSIVHYLWNYPVVQSPRTICSFATHFRRAATIRNVILILIMTCLGDERLRKLFGASVFLHANCAGIVVSTRIVDHVLQHSLPQHRVLFRRRNLGTEQLVHFMRTNQLLL